MRRVRGSFWTPARDRRLQALEDKGLSGAAIAEKLGITRNAVLGRSQRLRGLTVTYKAYVETLQELRAANEPKRRQRERRIQAALTRLQSDLAKGVPRDVAIMTVRKQGATCRAIANELGLTKQRVHQIVGRR
jgi:hypothetical protein